MHRTLHEQLQGRSLFHSNRAPSCCMSVLLLLLLLLAGEDLVFMVPNKIQSSQRYSDTAAVLRASLSSGRIAMPPVHKRMGFSDSAMAAAQVWCRELGAGFAAVGGWPALDACLQQRAGVQAMRLAWRKDTAFYSYQRTVAWPRCC